MPNMVNIQMDVHMFDFNSSQSVSMNVPERKKGRHKSFNMMTCCRFSPTARKLRDQKMGNHETYLALSCRQMLRTTKNNMTACHSTSCWKQEVCTNSPSYAASCSKKDRKQGQWRKSDGFESVTPWCCIEATSQNKHSVTGKHRSNH